MKKDYYKVLGVERSASDAAIKQRYRDLSKQNHPDVNGGDHTAMMKINEAYAVLSNPTKRRNYDYEYDAKHGAGGSFTDGSVKQQTYSPSPDKRSPYKRPPAPQKPKNPTLSGLSILGYGFGVLVALLVLAYVIVVAG